MRDYAKKRQPVSRTMESNQEAADQASITEILQRHQEPVLVQEELFRPESENKTGLPDNLKTGIETMSGYSMDDVKVHYNSDKPALLDALAYAQGRDIHLAPGQEKHLPHEAWHVVQQKQGRVQSTMQMQGVEVNCNETLEREADMMGSGALSKGGGLDSLIDHRAQNPTAVTQLVKDTDMADIYMSLELPYRYHYDKKDSVYKPDLHITDLTFLNMWDTLKNIARNSFPRDRRSLANINEYLDKLSAAQARELLVHAANELSDKYKITTHGEEPKDSKFLTSSVFLNFEVPGIGRGTIEYLKKGGAPKDVILFAAHGFQRTEGLSHAVLNVEKAYGFMSPSRVSVTRNTVSEAMYKELKDSLMADLGRYKILGVPELVVQPHEDYDVIRGEAGMLSNVGDEMDIAILRSWKWFSGTPLADALALAYVSTVPLAFIVKHSILNGYSNYLMQVCRADWSRTAGQSGGKSRTEPVLSEWA